MMMIGPFIRKHWFNVAIPATVAFSYTQPEWFRSKGTLRVETWKDAATMTMFVCSGVAIPGIGAFRAILGQQRHVWIQGMSLLVFPVCVYATVRPLAKVLDLPDACVTGAIFASCLPTTIGLSIALTRAAGGSVLLATFHSALGNTIGPFVTSLTAALLVGVSATTSPQDIATRLATLIIGPLGIGLGLRRVVPSVFASAGASQVAGYVQQLCLLTVLSNVFSTAFHKRQSDQAAADKASERCVGEHGRAGAAPSNILSVDVLLRTGLMMAAYHSAAFVGAACVTAALPGVFGGMATSTAAVYCATQKTAAMGIPMLDLLFAGRDDLEVLVAPLLLYHMFQIMFGAMVGPHVLRAVIKRP